MNNIKNNNIKFTYQNLYDFIYNVITSKQYFVTNKITNNYKNSIEFLLNQNRLNPELSKYWVAHNSIAFYNDDLLECYIKAIAFNTYKLKSMIPVMIYVKSNNRMHTVLKHKRFASTVYVNISDIYNYMITNKDDLFNHMYRRYMPYVPNNIKDDDLINLFCADKTVCLEVMNKVVNTV